MRESEVRERLLEDVRQDHIGEQAGSEAVALNALSSLRESVKQSPNTAKGVADAHVRNLLTAKRTIPPQSIVISASALDFFPLFSVPPHVQSTENVRVRFGAACACRFYVMAGSDGHLKPFRLFDLALDGGSQITEEERTHLRECEECQRILATFIRQLIKT
jgi:hypothetical protein